MTDNLSTTERLSKAAARFRALRRYYPELSDVKVLNRLHAEGVDATLADIAAGEKLLDNNPKLGNFTALQIAKAVNVRDSKVVKALIADPPTDMPAITLAFKRGVVSYYAVDLEAFVVWYQSRKSS